MPSDRPMCPLLTTRETPPHLEGCLEKGCAWWDDESQKCGFLAMLDTLVRIRKRLEAVVLGTG